MNHFLKSLLFLICLFILPSCKTVFGPPGSESDMPIPYPPHREYGLFVDGEPNKGFIVAEEGYYLWRDGNVWHIEANKRSRSMPLHADVPLFSGRILVEEGIISHLRLSETTHQYEVRIRGHDIAFRFDRRGDLEGFSFEIQPLAVKYCMTFDLLINGVFVSELVHLGRSMYRPKILPLVICPFIEKGFSD